MRMSGKWNLVWVLLLSSLFLSCGGNEVKERKIKTVKTAVVTRDMSTMDKYYPGKVMPSAESNLSYRIAGPIKVINVKVGQHVKKGDVLAVMDRRDYELQFSATEAEYKQIKAQAERAMELYKRGSATKSDYDKAFYGLKQITAKYNAHKNSLNDTELRAPYNGYITRINFREDETVGAGMPVISMISDEKTQMEIFISSSDFVRVGEMANFTATIDAYPDLSFPLELIDVAKQANLNQLFSMKFGIELSDGVIPAPGMSASVKISFRNFDDNTVCIPYSAVFSEGDEGYVWVYRDGRVAKRHVDVFDVDRAGVATVTAGLAEGEIVVSAGVHHLKDGEQVRLLPQRSPSNVGNVL